MSTTETQTFTRDMLEYAAIEPPRIDREAAVVRGVLVLRRTGNGREYLGEALGKAALLFDGAKVNFNPSNGDAPRDYRDRFGSLANVAVCEAGLRGDLHYNPRHPLAEQFVWDAEHAPASLGISANAEARFERRDGKTVVQEILRVRSVDIVGDLRDGAQLFEAKPDEFGRDSATNARIQTDAEMGMVNGVPNRFAGGIRKILNDPALSAESKIARIEALVRSVSAVEAEVTRVLSPHNAQQLREALREVRCLAGQLVESIAPAPRTARELADLLRFGIRGRVSSKTFADGLRWPVRQ